MNLSVQKTYMAFWALCHKNSFLLVLLCNCKALPLYYFTVFTENTLDRCAEITWGGHLTTKDMAEEGTYIYIKTHFVSARYVESKLFYEVPLAFGGDGMSSSSQNRNQLWAPEYVESLFGLASWEVLEDCCYVSLSWPWPFLFGHPLLKKR